MEVVKDAQNIILDTDMGTDDAWALKMLLQADHLYDHIKLLAVTCVQGNTSLNYVLRNTYRILKSANRLDIPIYKGASESLLSVDQSSVKPFHGIDGMCDLEGIDDDDFLNRLDELVQPEHAVVQIYKLVMSRPKEISIVCIGPMTNIALAFKMFPEIKENIKELFIMGGNYSGIGNVTKSAEFNFYIDPEAANIALECAKCPITILPWEACYADSMKISLDWRFNKLGLASESFLQLMDAAERKCYDRFSSWMPCDAFLTCAILFPKHVIEKSRTFHVTVELGGFHTRGQMVLDHLKSKPDNVHIIELVSSDACKEIFIWTISGKFNSN